MDNDAVVEDWKQAAENRDEENYPFFRSMKFQDYGLDPDDLAGQKYEEAFQIADCALRQDAGRGLCDSMRRQQLKGIR